VDLLNTSRIHDLFVFIIFSGVDVGFFHLAFRCYPSF